MTIGYKLGSCLDSLENSEYDYIFTSPPCYEDLSFFGVTKKEPASYKTAFLDPVFKKLSPRLGTITVAFTGSRRTDGRILSKSFYLQQTMYEAGFYLRDHKFAKKSDSFNAYSHQIIEILTFQRNGTKSIYNLKKNKSYATYGRDCWGPFYKELLIDGEVVGQPIEIAEYCIKNFTDEGHIVFDPFAGIGTTLAAAKYADRRYLGFEIREEIYQYGVNRFGI